MQRWLKVDPTNQAQVTQRSNEIAAALAQRAVPVSPTATYTILNGGAAVGETQVWTSETTLASQLVSRQLDLTRPQDGWVTYTIIPIDSGPMDRRGQRYPQAEID